jgi:uncharacterized protein
MAASSRAFVALQDQGTIWLAQKRFEESVLLMNDSRGV